MSRVKSDLEKVFEEIYESVRQKAKKEVFDDVAKGCRESKDLTQLRVKMFVLKEKHLNTSNTDSKNKEVEDGNNKRSNS